jgi:hypothetical protein
VIPVGSYDTSLCWRVIASGTTVVSKIKTGSLRELLYSSLCRPRQSTMARQIAYKSAIVNLKGAASVQNLG